MGSFRHTNFHSGLRFVFLWKPDAIGTWSFEGNGTSGTFEVTPPTSHGPVREYYLAYFGGYRPRFRSFTLPEGQFAVDVIDTWNMTISRVAESAEGSVRVELPARPYVTVRMEKV